MKRSFPGMFEGGWRAARGALSARNWSDVEPYSARGCGGPDDRAADTGGVQLAYLSTPILPGRWESKSSRAGTWLCVMRMYI